MIVSQFMITIITMITILASTMIAILHHNFFLNKKMTYLFLCVCEADSTATFSRQNLRRKGAINRLRFSDLT